MEQDKRERNTKLFTSEHVSPGHPDKLCDTISDAILDAHYEKAPRLTTRVAVETLAKSDQIVLAGEVTSEAEVDYEEVVRETLKETGYTPDVSPRFNYEKFKLTEIMTEQSPDIADCVDQEETGAGDQGIMFGYAVNEAPDLTGWAHYISRQLVSELWKLKLANDSAGLPALCPDYKVQVTMDYGGETPSVDTVLVSVSHTPEADFSSVCNAVVRLVEKTLDTISGDAEKTGRKICVSRHRIMVNPYGPFTVFGPEADSGLTGRKIVCDQYGGYAPVGGGAFSGKDLTKVDRTAAYMARYLAKNTLNMVNYRSSRLPEWLNDCGPFEDCSVEAAYIIGQAEPVSVRCVLKTDLGEEVNLDSSVLEQILDCDPYEAFKPEKIVDRLKLLSVDYSEVARFGHIGLDTTGVRKPWEDLV